MEYLNAMQLGDPVKLAMLASELSLSSNHAVRIISTSALMDVPSIDKQLIASNAQVLIVDSGVAGFDLNALLQKKLSLPQPVLLVGLAPAGTGAFDNLVASGLDKVYPLPLSPATIQQIDNDLPPLFEKISKEWGRGAFGAVIPQALGAAVAASTQSGWKSGSIAVISPKGGSGKTSTSVELAVMLSQVGQLRVVLADMNMVSGHDRFFLGASAQFSVANAAMTYKDWVTSGGTGSPPGSIFEPYLYSIDPDRKKLFLLPGIISSNQASKEELSTSVAAGFVRDLMDYLKRNYDFTIVDLGSDINKIVHDAVLKNADFILFVIPPNRAALADARDYINTLEQRGISKENIKLVLNNVPETPMENMPTLDSAAKTLGIIRLGEIHKETTLEYENTVNIGRSFVARFVGKDNNPKSIETVLRDLVVLGSNFFPPLGAIWTQSRKGKGEKKGFSFGKGNK